MRRTFDPPAKLLVGGEAVALINAPRFEVGEVAADPILIRSARDVAWLIRDALTGARVWVVEDGQVWSTDE